MTFDLARRFLGAAQVGALAALLGWAAAPVAARSPEANQLFDWAQASFPQFFNSSTASNELLRPYLFRRYPSGHFLAVADDQVFALGPATGNVPLALGPITGFGCQVFPADCGQPSGLGSGTGAELADVNAFLAQAAGLWARGVPADGAAAMAQHDSCYLDNGLTRDALAAQVDANPTAYAQVNAARVGEERRNVALRGLRQTTNADGSVRREIDIAFDLVLRDGTTSSNQSATLVSGSTHGSCATPQNSANLRWLGNRRLVGVAITARNTDTVAVRMSDGVQTGRSLRRDWQFNVTDPAGNATYVILSGPGPGQVIGGVTYTFSLKLVSPRLLRSDPAFAGKRDNIVNWPDDTPFRACRIANNSAPPAVLADCVGQGANEATIGWTLQNPSTTTALSQGDTGFDSYGLGGTYAVAVYNDDGWKTPGGHVGKTPVAVYGTTRSVLPYGFVQMANATPLDPYAHMPGLTPSSSLVQLAEVFRQGARSSVNVQLTPPGVPDGDALRLLSLTETWTGPTAEGATSATLTPAERGQSAAVIDSASASVLMPIGAKTDAAQRKANVELAVTYGNRNGRVVRRVISFN
jgi:hypothetical protein